MEIKLQIVEEWKLVKDYDLFTNTTYQQATSKEKCDYHVVQLYEDNEEPHLWTIGDIKVNGNILYTTSTLEDAYSYIKFRQMHPQLSKITDTITINI